MNGWTVGWIAWWAWFAIEEGAALKKVGTRGTLSYFLWTVFGTRRDAAAVSAPGPLPTVRRVALLAALAWLVPHLLLGGTFV